MKINYFLTNNTHSCILKKMSEHTIIKKLKDEVERNELKLKKMIIDIERIWEDTGLEQKDPNYLIEKTMRFEMAHENISKAFLLFNEIINDYRKLVLELENSSDS